MSLLSYVSHISLTGPMKKAVRILDAAKKNLGTDKVIDYYVSLPDLLDEECMKDGILQEKKRHFDELGFKKFMLEQKKGDNDDEEYLDYLEDSIEEDYSNARMIAIVGTGETDNGFEIKFELWEEENCPIYADWLDWGDIARVYGCAVYEDVELHRNGDFMDFRSANIYESKNGEVKETHILPEHNLEEYAHQFNQLIEINPQRYRPLKIRLFENWIRRIQNEVNRERMNLIKDNLGSTGGRAIIPYGITYIPGWMFVGCEDLTSIYIPESVSELGGNLFDRSGLASIEVDPKNQHLSSKWNCLLDKEGKTLYFGCKTSVIPDGVEVIAERAFEGCLGLEEIVLPPSIREIGNHAFDRCENLSRITLNEGLTEIGGSAFLLCASIKHISIPNSVATIYGSAFRDCSSLKEIVLPEGVTRIISNTFDGCTSLERVVIPEGVTEIGGNAFAGCSSLKEVVIPKSVKQIRPSAFKGCPCEKAVMKECEERSIII